MDGQEYKVLTMDSVETGEDRTVTVEDEQGDRHVYRYSDLKKVDEEDGDDLVIGSIVTANDGADEVNTDSDSEVDGSNSTDSDSDSGSDPIEEAEARVKETDDTNERREELSKSQDEIANQVENDRKALSDVPSGEQAPHDERVTLEQEIVELERRKQQLANEIEEARSKTVEAKEAELRRMEDEYRKKTTDKARLDQLGRSAPTPEQQAAKENRALHEAHLHRLEYEKSRRTEELLKAKFAKMSDEELDAEIAKKRK